MSQDPNSQRARKLALIQGILEGAFFAPLGINEWPAFLFDAPGLLGLEDDEAFDIFIRGALAAETLAPESAEGRTPLGWLYAMPGSGPVLAQVLASLRFDRPFLFHRAILSLSAVSQGSLNPDEFDLVEDFLQKALENACGLTQAAAGEWETLTGRAFRAAGVDLESPGAQVESAAQEVLGRAAAKGYQGDSQLLMWLAMGGGLDGIADELAPAVMVEAWRRFSGMIIGARPDLELLAAFKPRLGLTSDELSLYTPAPREANPVIKANCPYCAKTSAIALANDDVNQKGGCEHLLFVGTSDEVHLLEVLGHFDLGADFKALISSYYQSPADLELFATIINDLYEMLIHQQRLQAAPVSCDKFPQAFYFLSAFFAGPAPDKTQQH